MSTDFIKGAIGCIFLLFSSMFLYLKHLEETQLEVQEKTASLILEFNATEDFDIDLQSIPQDTSNGIRWQELTNTPVGLSDSID